MAKKSDATSWEKYQRMSKAARSRVDEVIHKTEQLPQSDNGDPVNAQRVLNAEMMKWKDTSARLLDSMTKSSIALVPLRDAAVGELADALKRSLEASGRSVFGESQTMVADGIVYIEVDLQAGRVKINGKAHRDLRVDSLTMAVSTAVGTLMNSTSEGSVFGNQLLLAYEQLISMTGAAFSNQVKTMELLPLVALQRQEQRFLKNPEAANFNDYPMALFRADLYGLLASGRTTIGDCSFHWSSGSTTDGAIFMYVPSLGRTAHLGRIWFEQSAED